MPRGKVNETESNKNQTTTTGMTAEPTFVPEPQRQMIAEAAYFRAEQRGFQGGDPVQDWVEAEKEISLPQTTDHTS